MPAAEAPDPAERLHVLARETGSSAAREKRRLLERIAGEMPDDPTRLEKLRGALWFIRAYPDDHGVLSATRQAIAALPAPKPISYPFSWETARRLVALHPDLIDVDWPALGSDVALQDTLFLLVSKVEAHAIEDIDVPLRDWLAARRSGAENDLGLLARLLAGSGLSAELQSHLFERSALPLKYATPDPLTLDLPVAHTHFQRSPLDRETFPLETEIRRAPPRLARGGRAILDLAMLALAPRKLEIYPLLHGNPRDVVMMDGGRGLLIALVGVVPARRSALEALHFFLVLKNGLPIAYGPAAVSFGCCEMGINLFPELRGAEIRHVYAQLMRLLRHRLGVDYFYLTRYGMGEGNEEAIRSGAFWFYRKLGFRPTSARVEKLALREESMRAENPEYRCDRATLLRLSNTEAFFDLSSAARRPMPLGKLGLAQSRLIASFGADDGQGRRRCATRVARALGGSASLLADLAPLLSLVEDLPAWSRQQKGALLAILRAKSGRSEARAACLVARHGRLEQALRSVAGRAEAWS